MRPLPSIAPIVLLNVFAAAQDHLLITEVATQPTAGEFIEIFNPTGDPVNLTLYYLADDEDYAILAGAFGAGPAPLISSFDFVGWFPHGAIIGPGEIQTVAVDGAGFLATYGQRATYELLGTDEQTMDMAEAVPGLIGSSAGLSNAGECVVLFIWDQVSDLVVDVDMLNVGDPSSQNDIPDKTGLGVDGPDDGDVADVYLDEAFTMPAQTSAPGSGESTKRLKGEKGFEIFSGGNGIDGHDETTEDITQTWDSVFTAPTPGAGEPDLCVADTDGSGSVDVDDLVNVILHWGTDGAEPGVDTDLNDDGTVDVDDLVAVILAWGPC